jgi:Spy/CpxP family protein refolding chaperone
MNAQDADKSLMNLQEFEKNKQEFIIKEAGLTEEEADKFFPINNELQKKKLDLHRKHQEDLKLIKESKDISDAEYEQLIKENIDLKMKEAELDKEYSDKFNKLISPQKLFKAQQAERTFMQEELRKFRESKKDGRITTGRRFK